MMDNQETPKPAESVNEESRKIIEELSDNIKKYDYEQVSYLLSNFRILTREKTLTKDVLNDDCMKLLVDCSRDYHTEAQKCLSNLILNYAHVRENLVPPYVECVDSRLKDSLQSKINTNESQEKTTSKLKFLGDKLKTCEVLYYDLRIIFLLSALCSGSRASIRDRLLDSILEVTRCEAEEFGPENYLLIIESLKTLFNLTLDRCINTKLAAQVIKKLFDIVGTEKERKFDSETGAKFDPTDQLLVNLIHLLTNMPEQVYHELSDDDVNKVLQHLDEQVKTFKKSDFRDTVLPVLNACANICRYKEDVRQRWFDEIIGSTKEFEKRPEEYDTLRGRLVGLMTSVDVHIKEIAAEFLYALCGGDTEKFITYTGFGNSAAFLSTKGLLSHSARRCTGSQEDDQAKGEGQIVEVQESDADKQYREIRERLDPITGKLGGPKRDPMEGLSEEEKEWHAHELASAITKLSSIGIMRPMGINAEGEISELDPRSQPPKQQLTQQQRNSQESRKDSDVVPLDQKNS